MPRRYNQSKRHSIIESVSNTLSGTAIAFLVTAIMLDAPIRDIGMVTIVLTLISPLRSYIVRRMFNYAHGLTWTKLKLKIAKDIDTFVQNNF